MTTGTNTVKLVNPNSLAQSVYGKRVYQIAVTNPQGSVLSTGDGKAFLRIDTTINGWNLVEVGASVSTVSSSGNITVQIHNVTDAVDMLSTVITIEASENDSTQAATQPVINTSNDGVSTADQLRIDVDSAGTGTKGLNVTLTFQLP